MSIHKQRVLLTNICMLIHLSYVCAKYVTSSHEVVQTTACGSRNTWIARCFEKYR